MKRSRLSLILTGASLLTPLFLNTAYAQPIFPNNPSINTIDSRDSGITPYYLFIQGVRLNVTCSSSKISYTLVIDGTSNLKSVSGTATLYKKASSGIYEKKDSKNLSLSGSSITKVDSFSSYGAGTYKVAFHGTAYSYDGQTDSIDIEMTDSY